MALDPTRQITVDKVLGRAGKYQILQAQVAKMAFDI
jgi:hypothetical protein